MIKDLFSNFIYSDHLKIDNQTLETLAYSIKKVSPGVFISNEGGWQSEPIIRELLVQPLISIILDHANKLHKQIGLSESYVQTLDNIWFNINGYKNYNHAHLHPGSCFSGVYYVKAEEYAGGITFMTPITPYYYTIPYDAIDIESVTPDKPNRYLGSGWLESSEVGKILLFPSWLMHLTQPNLSNSDRISIAFNTRLTRK
jgi:uncharacterized protein (TIGR02466 family)